MSKPPKVPKSPRRPGTVTQGAASAASPRQPQHPQSAGHDWDHKPPQMGGDLRFTPYAWAKLVYMRDIGGTEVGGFGISEDPDDLLLIHDFVLTEQDCTMASVDFSDEGIAEFTMDMVERRLHPKQFLRVWIHTHPNMSARPSSVDEETFARVFEHSDWAVMAIVSKSGSEYCRLQMNATLRRNEEIDMDVDYSEGFKGTDHEAWKEEYDDKVTSGCLYTVVKGGHSAAWYDDDYDMPHVPGRVLHNGHTGPATHQVASGAALVNRGKQADSAELWPSEGYRSQRIKDLEDSMQLCGITCLDTDDDADMDALEARSGYSNWDIKQIQGWIEDREEIGYDPATGV